MFNFKSAIASFPQLAYAYLRIAMSREKQETLPEAVANYERYIVISIDASSAMLVVVGSLGGPPNA